MRNMISERCPEWDTHQCPILSRKTRYSTERVLEPIGSIGQGPGATGHDGILAGGSEIPTWDRHIVGSFMHAGEPNDYVIAAP